MLRGHLNYKLGLGACRCIHQSSRLSGQGNLDFLKSLTSSLEMRNNQRLQGKPQDIQSSTINVDKNTASNKRTLDIFSNILNNIPHDPSSTVSSYSKGQDKLDKKSYKDRLEHNSRQKNRNMMRNDSRDQVNYSSSSKRKFNINKSKLQDRNQQTFNLRPMPKNFENGTEKARMAINRTMDQIYEINPKGTVNFVNSETKQIHSSNISKLVQKVDLSKSSIDIVNVTQNRNGQDIPVVKFIDIDVAVKKYNDYLGDLREKELAQMGINKKKSTNITRTKEKLKHVKVSWQITFDDFKKQKLYEVKRLIEKGLKVRLFFADKDEMTKKNWLENFDIDNVESHQKPIPRNKLQARQALIEEACSFLEEELKTFEIKGNIEHRMIVELTPKPESVKSSSSVGVDLREERKRKRQERLLRNLEKKRNSIM